MKAIVPEFVVYRTDHKNTSADIERKFSASTQKPEQSKNVIVCLKIEDKEYRLSRIQYFSSDCDDFNWTTVDMLVEGKGVKVTYNFITEKEMDKLTSPCKGVDEKRKNIFVRFWNFLTNLRG